MVTNRAPNVPNFVHYVTSPINALSAIMDIMLARSIGLARVHILPYQNSLSLWVSLMSTVELPERELSFMLIMLNWI